LPTHSSLPTDYNPILFYGHQLLADFCNYM